MTVTLSRQDSPEYREFSKEVRKRSHAKYGKDVYGDEVIAFGQYLIFFVGLNA